MGKEKFPANVRPAAADVQEEEQSRFTGRTIKSKKHLRGPIVREEASPERGLPQLEDSSIIPAKGSDVNATSSAVSQVVQARTDVVIGGGEGESDSAQVSEIISAEDLDSTSEEVESTISSSSNSGLHRRSRKLATMMSVDENNSLLSAAARESDEVQKVSKPKATAHSRMKHTQPASTPSHFQIRKSPLSSDAIFNQSHAGLFNLCLVILIAVNNRLIIENLMKYGLLIQAGFWFSSRSLKDWPLLMCGLTLPVFPISALLVEKLKLYTPISEKVFLCM
ncbi:unnamed protein product [Sphagnum jensenii]|uniref:diacylglycerol O-acyltransferase n=1 Tax=Sphagnum jensenii TaxID=128206 RepID=A0ABP1B536_9BRYO